MNHLPRTVNPDNTRKFQRVLVWMRRTLRVADNGPLWYALREGTEVVPFVCAHDGFDDEGVLVDNTDRERYG